MLSFDHSRKVPAAKKHANRSWWSRVLLSEAVGLLANCASAVLKELLCWEPAFGPTSRGMTVNMGKVS